MTKVDIDLDITNIDDCTFIKLDSNNKPFEVNFSGRYWEVVGFRDDKPQWASRALTPEDRKARKVLFKQMYQQHEDVLRRKREQSGERTIERQPNRPTVANNRLKQAVRTQQNW